MIKVYCEKCGVEILFEPGAYAIDHKYPFIVTQIQTNKVFHLCNSCGEQAIKTITTEEAVNKFLRDIGKQGSN